MFDSVPARALAVVLLLAGIAGLCVWHGTLAPNAAVGAYPDEGDFLATPDAYLGDLVTVGGTVVDTDPLTIEVEGATGERVSIRVTGVDDAVTDGSDLRVFGTLTDERTVDARNSFTVPRTGYWYTYSVSFLSGLWVLWRIVRHWRYDPSVAGLTPRSAAERGSLGTDRLRRWGDD